MHTLCISLVCSQSSLATATIIRGHTPEDYALSHLLLHVFDAGISLLLKEGPCDLIDAVDLRDEQASMFYVFCRHRNSPDREFFTVLKLMHISARIVTCPQTSSKMIRKRPRARACLVEDIFSRSR